MMRTVLSWEMHRASYKMSKIFRYLYDYFFTLLVLNTFFIKIFIG